MRKIILFLGLSLFLASCSAIPVVVPQGPDTISQTQVAIAVEQTLAANQMQTQAVETEVAVLTQNAPLPTKTSQPTDTITPTFTQIPSNTPEPTNTRLPTSTPKPTATSTPVVCNWAGFVRDMTVADGAQFPANARFTKVWRLKNIGSCTWTTNYQLVFEGGRIMAGSAVPLPKKVAPGETVDIALPLKAPADKGTYQGSWILTDANGKKFGVGSGANKPVWVQIEVSGAAPQFSYDFAANFWTAAWKTDDATLYLSGTSEAYDNYVLYTNKFRMESGKWEDEPAVIVNVESGERVRGVYPSYKVKPGDRFVSQIGCIYGSPDCKVKMVLAYQVKGSDNRVALGEWVENFNGDTTLIDIDLSSLAGKDVIFILDMEAKSQAKTNEVFWFVPSIRNP